ncbi:hypothetical protein ADL00_02275 [Streptomyces sp. AS58]|uniref:Nucleoside phosphorylase domain-containing protein n=1 Tax=Streptomyces cadmiisoli TaxID=2184053 RepID=A0A2Z4ISP4_9ACTN|nr:MULTISPECIES: hypothetical protein [Streptomyces]AWW36002.1 hypothetical protein DN051_04520 [Streptomyces cadmiisoli]KOV74652.1 hypothetical protein ADL00_02275 [Streptomyces sp. AS58]
MWKPRPPDDEWRRTARRALLGSDEAPGSVVLTPMGRLFRAVTRQHTVRTDGWLTTGTFGAATVVWTPQGQPVADALAALEPGTHVTFVGLCGSLRRHPLGSAVAIAAAVGADGRRHHPRLGFASAVTHATNAQVTSFLEAEQRHAELTGLADTVDMETATVLACAEAFGLASRALLLVSDHNRSPSPFTAPPHPMEEALRRLPYVLDRLL